MRPVAISIISIFACFSAFANARLPVVNVGAGSVSARAAFGDVVETKNIVVAPVQKSAPAKKIVARGAAPVDAGQNIAKVTGGDVLMPKRPSGDLWARTEKPLRLPEPSEFAVIRNDFELPEESLDMPKVVARKEVATMPVMSADASALDAEIAKLVELQRRADDSVRVAAARPAPVAAPTTISSYDIKPTVTARAAVTEQPVAPARKKVEPVTEEIAVRRVVVPMEEEVYMRPVASNETARVASADVPMSKMSPTELKKAFKKTYLSENKHLSTYRIDDRFDVASDLSTSIEGFTSTRDLSESGGVRPLEIKISFRSDDSALSRENYNLLSEYASIVVSNPKRAIQISIPERATRNLDGRKLAARRLAIVEQVLKDTGVSDQRIMPVLSQRNDDGFVLRVISSDQFETMTQQKRDMFGDTTSNKTYKSMSW